MDTLNSPIFGVVVVPSSCNDEVLWQRLMQKYKAFRLQSLQESPEAFASTYEREVEFGDEVWAGRLANPQATMLVALPTSLAASDTKATSKVVETLVDEEWMAMTVLIQPGDNTGGILVASKSPWEVAEQAPSTTNESQDIPRSVLFVLNGVYVAAGHRGRGVGKAVLLEAFQVAKVAARTRRASETHLQVRVAAENLAARRLYESVGFRAASHDVIVKDANGLPLQREIVVLVLDYQAAVSA
jgi:ribosomal protein S18 acetylase RimI-like enzyme